MTELEKEYEEKTGKKSSDILNICLSCSDEEYEFRLVYENEYVHHIEAQLLAERVRTGAMGAVIDGLSKEVDVLRSLTRWHYAPEVPEESGRYVCDAKWTGTIGDTYPLVIAFCENKWCTSFEIIRWAFLPKEGE